MALGYEWAEWHLTPDGWQRGSYKLDSQSPRLHDAPTERVKSVRYSEEMRMGSSPGLHGWTAVQWVGDASEADRLEAQFGPCPEQITDVS